MSQSDSELAKHTALARYMASVERQVDPIMLLLRAHLYTEGAMEALIRLGLPFGEKINAKARLGYNQKLIVCESLDIISNPFILALRSLNTVRNECAHQLDKEITFNDVIRIGSPLEGRFQVPSATGE